MNINIRSMGVVRFRNKYMGFCEKFILKKSINEERATIARVPMRA